ncbi:MAG: hypothetical protein MMC33_006382 [Icmadophila ericetorum]|nr:hypothetical protein [Icmadophila ericetorum]
MAEENTSTTTSTLPKNFFDSTSFDWQAYLRYRPTYTKEFYNLILDYHRSKEPTAQFLLTHDIGTGPGQVAEHFTQYFTSVIASDASAPYAAVARQRLEQSHPGKTTVVQFPAELLAEKFPAGEADLLTAAECLPLMNREKAFSSFAHLLKPGGTLAIWFYGRPFFVDPDMSKAQELYEKISTAAFSTAKPFKGGVMENAWTIIASWFDEAHFPRDEWEKVERLKVNPDREMTFLPAVELDYVPEWENGIRDDEKIEEKTDREWWARTGGVDFVRGFVDANMPWKKEYENEEVKGWYEELEKELRGKEHKVSWPVILMLATRK